MKKIMILAVQSLCGTPFDNILRAIPYLSDYRVIIFKGTERLAEISGLRENYDRIIDELVRHDIEIINVEVYGVDEFFWLLARFKKFREKIGYENDIYVSPTNSPYYIAISADILAFNGRLFFFNTVNESIGHVSFYEENYKIIARNPKWLKAGIDTTKIEFAKTADYSECHYTVDGEEYTEKVDLTDRKLKRGDEGCVCVSPESKYALKFWLPSKTIEQFSIDKIKHMISSHKPPYAATPLALIYSKNNVPIGVVMENINDGVSVLNTKYTRQLNNPVKYMIGLAKAISSLEPFSYFHPDIWHNLLFRNDKDCSVEIIDLDSAQFSLYPATAETKERRNMLPLNYNSHSRYYSTIDLSYWTAILIISGFLDLNKEPVTRTDPEDQNHFIVNKERLKKLGRNMRHCSELFVWQLDNSFPCSPLRWLEAVENDYENKEFCSSFSDLEALLKENIEISEDDPNTKTYRGDIPSPAPDTKESLNSYDYEPLPERYRDTTGDITLFRGDYTLGKTKKIQSEEDDSNLDPSIKAEHETPVITADKPSVFKRIRHLIHICFRDIMIYLFGSKIGTLSVAIDDKDVSEEERKEGILSLILVLKAYRNALIISISLIVMAAGIFLVASIL